jgi:hypothetical protein
MLEVRQDLGVHREPADRGRASAGQPPVRTREVVHAEHHLPQLIGAMDTVGRGNRPQHAGQQHGDQDGDDRYDHQQFDQSESWRLCSARILGTDDASGVITRPLSSDAETGHDASP